MICSFPRCNYESNDLGTFDNHHIIPKSLDGTDLPYNRIYLCPNCHRNIFVENMKNGVHSIKRDDSIIILGKIQSTIGEVLHYKCCKDEKEYYWWPKAKMLEIAD